MRRTSPFVVACAAVLTLVAAAAFGARNSSGTYSLPSGNPVVSGTTITSTWANSTLGDIGTELTDSLDRYGRGAMLAPLKSMDGSLSAPGLTFSSEQTSGLYRAGSGDVRMSVLDTEAQKWTSAASTISLPLTCSDTVTATNGLAVTTAVTDGTAVVSTGNEGGAGVSATGGADGGIGLVAQGEGGGSGTMGAGVLGTGGAAGGTGVYGVGGSGGDGMVGHGSGIGLGAQFQGGISGAGAQGIGGGSGQVGLIGIGGAGAEGGHFTAGTTATGSVPQNAVVLQGGYLSLDGVAIPNSGTAIKNEVTPLNIPKAWARIGCSSGSCSISRGFNVASVATNASNVALTLANAVGPGAVVVTSEGLGGWTQTTAAASSSTVVTIGLLSATGTAAVPNDPSFSAGINIVIYGSQF